MKLLSADQIRALDAHTIAHEPVASLDLMERAAKACCWWLEGEYDRCHFILVCGTGNNGGDGLAMARWLGGHTNYTVEVWVAGNPNEGSEDFKANFERLAVSDVACPVHRLDRDGIPEITAGSVVIDALFGTGLTRPVEGWRADVIRAMNASSAQVVSIDIPSGLPADLHFPAPEVCVQAHHTLTFHIPKITMLLREFGKYCGFMHVLDIGLDRTFHAQQQSTVFWTTLPEASALWKPRSTFEHKGSRGHVMLVAGSRGKMGAAVLSAHAALKSGCGLVTVHLPACGLDVVQTALPEAMCQVDEASTHITAVDVPSKIKALAIGPGIGTHEETAQAMLALVRTSDLPMVIDADALNILAASPADLKLLKGRAILTPHPREFDRLFGEHTSALDRLQTLKEKSEALGLVIVLKGAFTRVALPSGEVHFNASGNPGMATAGSGDVLTGIIGSLLAQGYSTEDAAKVGVYLHGLAGDEAVEANGSAFIRSGEIIDSLGWAIMGLEQASE